MTILESIQRGSEFLTRKGVGSPRLQVELLLAHMLRMPRVKLYINFERVLTAEETDALRAMVRRRGQREPCQYITASACFCGFEIPLNSHVLIPRPETESLAERAWTWLKKRGGPADVLELGTGSGCLAIAVACHAAEAKICATDISEAALELAERNALSNELSGRIQFRQGDLFAAVAADARFDLILSNPPYIPAGRIETLEPEVRDFEPRHALDGGADGQDFYRRIAAGAGALLRPGGRVMVELDGDGAPATRRIFEDEKWEIEAIDRDDNGHERILVARLANQAQDAEPLK
ncbi:MAG TPA: peptide chain release factor N(5)-glutamine methyltransferase [Verrucomicrobiae bacterium]|jgi:release factor glutamine methyltransferase